MSQINVNESQEIVQQIAVTKHLMISKRSVTFSGIQGCHTGLNKLVINTLKALYEN